MTAAEEADADGGMRQHTVSGRADASNSIWPCGCDAQGNPNDAAEGRGQDPTLPDGYVPL